MPRVTIACALAGALFGGDPAPAQDAAPSREPDDVRREIERVQSALAQSTCACGDTASVVREMEALLRMQRATERVREAPADRVAEAHAVLGVARNAPDAHVTKAYRRLMSHHHPDKLVAKGLPESMMALAQEKTRQIRAAYELIREARGMK